MMQAGVLWGRHPQISGYTVHTTPILWDSFEKNMPLQVYLEAAGSWCEQDKIMDTHLHAYSLHRSFYSSVRLSAKVMFVEDIKDALSKYFVFVWEENWPDAEGCHRQTRFICCYVRSNICIDPPFTYRRETKDPLLLRSCQFVCLIDSFGHLRAAVRIRQPSEQNPWWGDWTLSRVHQPYFPWFTLSRDCVVTNFSR